MSIFKRSKDSAGGDAVAGGDGPADAAQAPDASGSPRSDGPWDVAEVDGRDGRVDLGALWVRGVPGMELRLEVDQSTQQVNAATAVLGDSALQLQAFAAPRSSGLWDEIRREISAASGAAAARTNKTVVASVQERAVRLPLTYAVRTEALSRSRA